jgi:hypothetical protein
MRRERWVVVGRNEKSLLFVGRTLVGRAWLVVLGACFRGSRYAGRENA